MSDKQAKYAMIVVMTFFLAITIVGVSQRYFDAQVKIAQCEATDGVE